jgi:antitoxin (DNA-binding transcriptional repressor) of toxin-antitoxin stability system
MGHHSLPDVKENLSSLIDRATAGEQVLIVRDGQPVAEIRALAPTRTSQTEMTVDVLIAWLRERRIGRASADEDAVTSVRLMRDEEWG